MPSELASPRTAGARRFLPADGFRLLGEYQGGRDTGRRFLVGRGDGRVFQLPLLLYLIMAAIAEGSVDGGWSADQVAARVEAASGQGLAADNVRYLIVGKLAPLGLIAVHGPSRPDRLPGAALAPPADRVPGPKSGRGPLRHRAADPARPVLPGPIAGRIGRLLARFRSRRWALALGATAALVSVAAVVPVMTGTRSRATSDSRAASASASASAAAAAAAASRSQAAAWVAQQVSPGVTVSCDPGMCLQLRKDGFPGARLQPLPGHATVLLGSGVIVATPAIRRQFDARLTAAYAPQVIASFGSGAGRVDVRTIAPAGATAFETHLAAEEVALASVGRQLLGNKNIQASPSAQTALRAGQVDARLLAILSLLAAQLPVRVAAFTAAPGAGPGVPARGAEIGLTSAAARTAVVALLDAQQVPYRPAVAATGDGSRSVLTLRFDAPASLDLAHS